MKFPPVAYLVGSLLFAVSSTVSQPVFGAVNLLVSIETHNTPSKAASQIPPDSKESLEVTLADGFISVKSVQATTIYDFKTRRRIVLDNASSTSIEYSLYDTVGFRTIEFQNREKQRSALAAAKITSVSMSTVDNEHLLSIQSPSPAKIDEAIKQDDLVFSSNDRQFARWSRKGYKVIGADAERFAKFLRYNLGGHPTVLGKLATGNVIPDRLIFTFTETGWTSSRSISITALRQVDSNTIDLSPNAMRRAAGVPGNLDDVLDQAASLNPEEIERAKPLNQESVTNAFHSGKGLDAMLELLEWTLMTGQKMPPFSAEQLTMLRGDPSVQKLMTSLAAKTKEQFLEAVNTLVGLRSQAPKKSYVLKIFEANDRIRLGEFDASKRLFMEVLQNNLLLAGVYKDLGDLYFIQYDTFRAWRCWDIGRRFAPQFGSFAAVNQFEKTLAAQHPEYF
ncbi:MAG: hypothetical protein A3J49_17145 [Gallionellales bacterium RIFCSPHIGHO2_02_FULL_57_16]|nr:MAG: hypothetical protein A3J49_17145 [Gallionellales bacterium RIFCSPHIGHO2_02_FULL_57_16]